MRVLVTGAAGFLGTHVVERLLKDDHAPAAVDNLEGAISREVKQWYVRETRQRGRFDFFEYDISEYTQTVDLIREVMPDAIIHLAALHDGKSLQDMNRVNVTGTLNVLEAARRAGIGRFVLASSWEVYGDVKPPFDELSTLLEPKTALGTTKMIAERYARVYANLFHIQTAVLRFFPLYGPRQRPDMAFARIARSAIRKEKGKLEEDPNSRLDYTFVEDAADAVVRALDRSEEFVVFNVGTGVATKLKDAVKTLEEMLGAKSKLKLTNNSKIVPAGYAKTLRAQKSLGFKAKVNLKAGLRKYADWYAHMRPTVRMVK